MKPFGHRSRVRRIREFYPDATQDQLDRAALVLAEPVPRVPRNLLTIVAMDRSMRIAEIMMEEGNAD